MKVLVLYTLIVLSAVSACGQTRFNPELKRQLDSVGNLDQKYRGVLSDAMRDSAGRNSLAKGYHVHPDSLIGTLWKLQESIDSANLIFVENVIKRYGYPGLTLVGPKTNEAAWAVIQHSPKIENYLEQIKEAADKKELPFRLYAMMYDRYLMFKKEEQVYGTQLSTMELKNGESGLFVWPVKDPQKVNALRKESGFEQSVEENANRFNVVYRVIKISEIRLE